MALSFVVSDVVDGPGARLTPMTNDPGPDRHHPRDFSPKTQVCRPREVRGRHTESPFLD
ncbi:hypothetical protein [Knoellia sp. LjRoot47]|uniref:hypothetical protein n=1 Tax=Knoellia sp. LjRoot47 TaxID=3342330 RepID=UPI003ECF01EC